MIKLLEESESRVILLLAPAGYGKTTLARQWSRSLTRACWISFTPAHRDVALLAETVAEGIDSQGDATSFVREYVAGQSNPQRAHRQMAEALRHRLDGASAQWVVFDDYHELIGSPEAEEFVSLVVDGTSARYIIASRQRPTWASSRRVVYGEMSEMSREVLAMDDDESAELLGSRPAHLALARQAQGWPAVLGLAAAADTAAPPSEAVPSALHHFFAEELYQRVPAHLQVELMELALTPRLADGPFRSAAIQLGADVGFISSDERLEIHPLLREFLLEKLADMPDRSNRVQDAIERCARAGEWDGAIDLLTRFRSDDLVEPVLRRAFTPLVRSGRLATLSSLAAVFRVAPSFPPPSIDIVEAEAALRDGNYELAAQLAARVWPVLAPDHPLRARAAAIDGHSNVQLARFESAEAAFVQSLDAALDDADETEALHGLALTRMLSERGDVSALTAELSRRRHASPTHLLRAATAELTRRRLDEGLAGRLDLDEALLACTQAQDPRARTSFTYGAAYALALRGEYRSAAEWLRKTRSDIDDFDLEFAKPHAVWADALIQLGLRRFGQAEHALQTLEDIAAERTDDRLALNARSLRARLLIQTGKATEAVDLTTWECPDDVYPSWEGEYMATRAIALACVDRLDEATDAADLAGSTSRMAEVRGLVAAARSLIGAKRDDNERMELALMVADEYGVWDPVLTAIRSYMPLADHLAVHPVWKERLPRLYGESNDHGLSRRAGLRTRSTRSPEELLTPREMEVLNLIARGMKTQEIAKALFISPSTTKVHVRHIHEKLGVRTRAEAVMRLKRLD